MALMIAYACKRIKTAEKWDGVDKAQPSGH